jgi:hypothetical protein
MVEMAGTDHGVSASGGDRLPEPLGNLEDSVLQACAAEDVWPAQIAAGVNAGVDFVIANPDLAHAWMLEPSSDIDYASRYEAVVGRLTGFIRLRAPVDARLPASSDEALVAGIVGLVGDHVRIGRLDRLAELKPELVQLTLLPYLGFTESQRWANKSAELK